MYFQIDGVDVISNLDDLTEQEAQEYIDFVKERVKIPIIGVEVFSCPDGKIDANYTARQKFERIRRITGYLTGDVSSWNNAKRSEEHERVKHNVFE